MMTTDHDKLTAWFQEYALWNALGLPEDGDVHSDVDTDSFAEEPPPADGHIRLWPGGGQPLYGCLKRSGYGQWAVVPFSVLSEPATPQELRLRTSGPAQVLQGWNRRTVREGVAKNSWMVDVLREDEPLLVEQWLLTLAADGDPPPAVRDRVGPPLRHPFDPRQEHLQAEGTRVDGLLGEPQADYGAGQRPDSLAAESPEEEYGEEYGEENGDGEEYGEENGDGEEE